MNFILKYFVYKEQIYMVNNEKFTKIMNNK